MAPGGGQTAKKSGGRSPKQKGYRFENELRLSFIEHGLACRRVPLSGAGDEKGDLCLTTGWGETLKGEAKRRATLPSYLTSALSQHDFTVFREDRGETYVLITLQRFKEMCQ
jgi:Holliday junction resolvase